jgi:FMN-dependent NADH-azoreductase
VFAEGVNMGDDAKTKALAGARQQIGSLLETIGAAA